ncbi:hypothetical protein AAVH_15044 [Aphelenchoides avenae]|nr:hypothetical protein AAVH_15044 [Aphelenchus avenae]
MFLDDAALKNFVNRVLRDLHDHYRSIYHTYDERLGVIVSIVAELHRVICLHERVTTQLSLYTKRGQGMRFPSHKEAVNVPHDLRCSVKM